MHASAQMTEDKQNKVPMKNVAARVPVPIYRSAKRRLADSDLTIQALVVDLLDGFGQGRIGTGDRYTRALQGLLHDESAEGRSTVIRYLDIYLKKHPPEKERNEETTGQGAVDPGRVPAGHRKTG